MDALMARGES